MPVRSSMMNFPICAVIHEAPAPSITMRLIACGPVAGSNSPSNFTSEKPAVARPAMVSIHDCGCSAISLRR